MVRRLALSISALLLVSACATTEGPSSREPVTFRAADFSWSTASGRGRVAGQLVFRSSGKAYSCMSSGVVLTPETPWTRQRMETLYKSSSHAVLPAAEARARTPASRTGDYSAYVKHADCNNAGLFSFEGLPNGVWYAITVAKPVAPATGPDMAIMQRVEIRDGGTVSVKL
jgi:hypothetical protein